MKKWWLLQIAFVLLFIVTYAQPYTVGTKNISWTDPARSNRSVTLEFRYPGTNTALASGQFPFVIFAHGFQMDQVPYYPYSDSLAKQGYIVGLLTTETGLSPSHANFAQDLIFAYNKLISESNTNSASPFYQKVIPKGALGGHSMGGGCTVLSAQYGNPQVCSFTFAAATTNPSSITAAPLMTKPYLAFAGTLDCVAPPATNQLPMYDSSGSPCKTYINITNGRHCAFGNSNFQCNFGEGFSGCASSPLSTADQINKCLFYLVPFLDYYLKGSCPAWTLFESRYNSNTVDVLKKSCTNNIPTNPSIAGNTSFCNGNSTTLTAQPAGFTYVWNDNSTASTLIASSAGNYSLIVGNGTCWLPSVSVSVSENFPPATPSSITASDTVCSGIANIYLSVDSTASVTYNWTLPQGWAITQGNGTNAITAISGNSGGTISVTAENLCGVSQAVQKTVTVVPSNLGAAGAITGSDTVCQGQTAQYSISPVTGADNYVWILPQGWSFNSGTGGNAISITAGVTSGNITVQASNSCGQSSPSSVAVFAKAAAQLSGSISGPDTICRGATLGVTYTVNGSAANTYHWNLPADWAISNGAGTPSVVLNIGSSGTLTVSAQNECGTGNSLSLDVVVADTPSVTISQSGSDLVATGGDSYRWYFNGQLIQNATGATYTPTQSGHYAVAATNSNGCEGSSSVYNFTYNTITETAEAIFSIWPNPATDVVMVKLRAAFNGKVQLLSMNGKLLLEQELSNAAEQISLRDLPKGVYVICVWNSGKSYRQKLVVE